VERSLEMVVGLLGILKAGGAYAVGPRLSETAAFMLEDSQVPVLLTQEKFKETLPYQAKVICPRPTGRQLPRSGLITQSQAPRLTT